MIKEFWTAMFCLLAVLIYLCLLVRKKDFLCRSSIERKVIVFAQRIYNPITAMGFSAMLTFQLAPRCHNGSCRYVRAIFISTELCVKEVSKKVAHR